MMTPDDAEDTKIISIAFSRRALLQSSVRNTIFDGYATEKAFFHQKMHFSTIMGHYPDLKKFLQFEYILLQ